MAGELNLMDEKEMVQMMAQDYVDAMKGKDPIILSRVEAYLTTLATKLREAQKDRNITPPEYEGLLLELSLYKAVLEILIEERTLPGTKEQAFAEADINAQAEEAERVKF